MYDACCRMDPRHTFLIDSFAMRHAAMEGETPMGRRIVPLAVLCLVLVSCSGVPQRTTASGGGAAASSDPTASAPQIAEQPITPTPIPPTATTKPTVTPTMAATATTQPTVTSAPPSQAPTATPTDRPISTATPVARVLEPKWYQDSDGDGIPDFLEVELGANPYGDDCPSEKCGSAVLGKDLMVQHNTLLILDSSGSMASDMGGQTKLDVAKEALWRYTQYATTVDNIGFMVFGHKGNNTEGGKAASCVGGDMLAPIGQVQADTFHTVLEQFQPTGWTPLATTLTQATQAFTNTDHANRIILVSDGLETCDGDPVAVAKRLHDQNIAVEIDVIGFDVDDNSADAAQLRQVADVTKGTYRSAKDATELNNYFQEQGKAAEKTCEAMICELHNGFSTGVCDQQLVNKATDRILQLSLTAPPEEAAAYNAIADNIRASLAKRQTTYDEAMARSQELFDQYNKLHEQFQRAAFATMPRSTQ